MWTPWRLFRKSAKPLKADTPEWLQLWALVRYDLKLSEKEFWELSVDQLEALVARRNLELERQDYHAALICWVLANIHRGPKQKPYQITDFMPNAKRKAKQTPEQMISMLQGWQAFYGKKNE